MDFLARREHSFFELQQKLKTKFPESSADLIRSVIDTLRDENLQSDDRFAESYVRYRKGRGFGYLHIKADLGSRCVSETVISRYLDSEENWDGLLQLIIRKKLKHNSKVIRASKEHRRLNNFLSSRGFTSDQIRKGIEQWLV